MENTTLLPLLVMGSAAVISILVFLYFDGFIHPIIEQKYTKYILLRDNYDPYEIFNVVTKVYYKGRLIWKEEDYAVGSCKIKERKVEAKIICEKLSKLK